MSEIGRRTGCSSIGGILTLGCLAMGCGDAGNASPGTMPPTEINEGTTAITACPTTNVIADPTPFFWTYHAATATTEAYYSATLEFGEATFTIDGQTLTTRAY